MQVKYLLLSLLLCSSVAYCDVASTAFNVSANVISNTCSVTVANNTVTLDAVTKSYFDVNNLTPQQYNGGTTFSVLVNNCGQPGSLDRKVLHISFEPQGGVFPPQSNQVFMNELLPENGGAVGVGITVFSADAQMNVLNADGTSDITYDINGQSPDEFQKPYDFVARYQALGDVTPGQVKSSVLVGVMYD
ncbi:fimbrial-like protein [Dryocola sp. BD626]|uniref:fimbrial-like protein n=1 Tax=Dryocola sp. BD626 TaxID=3133273 RepID=UPI003F50119A